MINLSAIKEFFSAHPLLKSGFSNDPLLVFFAFVAVLLLLYFTISALYDTLDRRAVVEAAKQWAERKERRNTRGEARKLWDSVNQIKRGQDSHGHLPHKDRIIVKKFESSKF